MPADTRFHYVLSTHWDREWYQPLQVYRHRLVQLMDRIIAGIESGEMVGPFQTDGQAIILEDYLEIRPDMRDTVRKLVEQRKFVVGPWYVLPDEFLVSGESLIRNIRLGRQVARDFGGKPSVAGFACDLFGHASQLPQVFVGLGIRGGFIWRGTAKLNQREILWTGADGTELACYRFGNNGYCSYTQDARRCSGGGPPLTNDADRREALDAHIEQEHRASLTSAVLLFDGGDHLEWDRDNYRVLKQRMAENGNGRGELVHSSLDDYLDQMLAEREKITGRLSGELREPGREPMGLGNNAWLIPGVASSRVWIKQANAGCENRLCLWAEPFDALADRLIGAGEHAGYFATAWKWLLKNHPHDSICGCSIDQVHEDMKFRFSQSRQIADRLTDRTTRAIAASVAHETTDKNLRLVVFNPLPRAIDEPVDLTVRVPADWPTFQEFFGFEPKPAFRLFDADDNEVAYHRTGQAMGRKNIFVQPLDFPAQYRTNNVDVVLCAPLPPMGYTTLSVRPGDGHHPTRHPAGPTMFTSHRAMRNEHLAVAVESDGTLSITDRQNDQTYRDGLTFEDIADIGDGWYHGMAVNDRKYLSSACAAEIVQVCDTPLKATLCVRVTMQLPRGFRWDSMTRRNEREPLVIETDVTLRKGVRRVECRTRIVNTIKDHRLRVLFPTQAGAKTYWCDTPFDAVERPIALRADNHEYREVETEAKSQQSWTAVASGKKSGGRGLAVISTGLYESAVIDTEDQPIALTLYRSTRTTVLTNGEPGGQLLHMPLTFDYWVVPLAERIEPAARFREAQRLAAGIESAQLAPRDVKEHRPEGAKNQPAAASGLLLEGDAILTSLRRVDDAVEARLFNPTGKTIDATLAADWITGDAALVNFESNVIDGKLKTAKGRVTLNLGPKKIATVRFA